MTAPLWLSSANGAQAGRTLAMSVDTPWEVLLVDDDIEVHDVTRMVLADATFAGRPIRLASAYSAAEAKTCLAQVPGTALILLDVVMEEDHAGLDLVRYIREVMGNRDVQIVLRTGQPGMAPEADVIMQYEINGYFLKIELTAQKLTSIVVAGLRAYQHIKALQPAQAPLGPSEAFAATDAPQTPRQTAIVSDITAALTSGSVQWYVLPQIELASNAVIGVELRPCWPTREGALDQADLAVQLDDASLRCELDRLMLNRACTLARDRGKSATRVSVRLLSGYRDDELSGLVNRFLSEAGLQGAVLDLQLGSDVLRNSRMATRALQRNGVSITLVDFGPGLISLPELHDLRPDRIRIHHTFVRDVTHDPERAAVARSIIALAHTLGMVSTADGITSDDDLQFFRWEGCDLGQGDALAGTTRL